MNIILRKISFALIALFPMGAIASDSNFNDVLATVMSNNLTVKSIVATDVASIAELKAENTLDAPEMSYEHKWGNEGLVREFSISQSFDWPGVYAARRSAIKKSETAMQYLREASQVEIRQEVREALIDMINVRRHIATARQIRDGLVVIVDYLKQSVEQGNDTRLDYNKAVLEHLAFVRELNMLESDSAVIASSLQALNGGLDVTSLIDRLGVEYPDVELESLRPNRSAIREKAPEIAAAQANKAVQEALVKVEKRSMIPGFSVGYVHENEPGNKLNGFSVSMTLPFFTQKSKVKAASLRLTSLQLEEEMTLVKIASELQGEFETALKCKNLIDEYEGVVSDDSNFTLLRKAYDAGQINFLTYMTEINYFLAARRDFLEAQYRYNLSLARLQRYE